VHESVASTLSWVLQRHFSRDSTALLPESDWATPYQRYVTFFVRVPPTYDVMGKMRKRRKFAKLFSCFRRSQNDDAVQDDGISCSASSHAVAATCSAADDFTPLTKTSAAAATSCPQDMCRYSWSATTASRASVRINSHRDTALLKGARLEVYYVPVN